MTLIHFGIVLILIYVICKLIKWILILIEGDDYSPKKFMINSYRPKTVNSEINFSSIVLSIVLAMVALPLGAVAGAVASAMYQSPDGDEFAYSDKSLQWFWGQTLESPGGYLILTFLILALEITCFIAVFYFTKKRNLKIIEEVYGSLQTGEIDVKNMGDRYRDCLLHDIPGMFNDHPLVKKYKSVEKYSLVGFKIRKIIISYINLSVLIILFFVTGLLAQISDSNQNSPLQVVCGIIYFLVFSLFLIVVNYRIENKLQVIRRNKILPGYKILKEEYWYIIRMLLLK